jgi:hypothetical protein
MKRTSIAVAAGVATLAVTACGASEDGQKTAAQAAAAQAKIEQAAHVELAAETLPDDARKEGLRASYSDAATAVKDKQVIGLFVVKDADLADKVSAKVRQSAPKTAKLIVDGNVMVVYAAAGDDRFAAVKQAVKAL